MIKNNYDNLRDSNKTGRDRHWSLYYMLSAMYIEKCESRTKYHEKIESLT